LKDGFVVVCVSCYVYGRRVENLEMEFVRIVTRELSSKSLMMSSMKFPFLASFRRHLYLLLPSTDEYCSL
ncbi:MAG: hypothetical protein QXP38_11330, partial [Nitrososphaerota archaeon]